MSLNLTLAPGFLLSMPQLDDPNFSRAVVLMLQHDDEGSFGLIVNRPSQLLAKELTATIDAKWGGAPQEPVYAGGPVMPGSGWLLHSGSPLVPDSNPSIDLALDDTGQMKIAEDLFLCTSDESIVRLAAKPPRKHRFVLGYSGWAGGQLAFEMSQGSWLHADLDTEMLFATPADKLWERCLEATGIDAMSIVASRGIH